MQTFEHSLHNTTYIHLNILQTRQHAYSGTSGAASKTALQQQQQNIDHICSPFGETPAGIARAMMRQQSTGNGNSTTAKGAWLNHAAHPIRETGYLNQ
jgi:hypothetical protein